MSVIAMSAPRASVFTFESTAHSSHVLRCLDDQRRRDVLCDVTVVAEGQGFRAHRSVLAACSEYFTHRISPLTQHGAVITLPQEVRRRPEMMPHGWRVDTRHRWQSSVKVKWEK